MKHFIILAMLASIFVGCASDGSREIQIDDVKYTNGLGPIEPSVFEIVPGKYTISWRVTHESSGTTLYNVAINLKLRLKKTVKIRPEIYEKMNNISAENRYNDEVSTCFGIYLLDANGKQPHPSVVNTLKNDYLPQDEWASKGTYNKDAMMDFINFLASEPGTEIEVICNTIGSNGAEDVIKNAKGIECAILGIDYGTVVE